MTEFEINKAVADKLNIKYVENGNKVCEIVFFSDDCISPYSCEFDPCNNPSQAWEIMMKYNICVTRGDDGNYDAFQSLYCAGHTTFYYENCLTHEKPLVAVCLCFLEINK